MVLMLPFTYGYLPQELYWHSGWADITVCLEKRVNMNACINMRMRVWLCYICRWVCMHVYVHYFDCSSLGQRSWGWSRYVFSKSNHTYKFIEKNEILLHACLLTMHSPLQNYPYIFIIFLANRQQIKERCHYFSGTSTFDCLPLTPPLPRITRKEPRWQMATNKQKFRFLCSRTRICAAKSWRFAQNLIDYTSCKVMQCSRKGRHMQGKVGGESGTLINFKTTTKPKLCLFSDCKRYVWKYHGCAKPVSNRLLYIWNIN